MAPNLENRLIRLLQRANREYELISPGDRILLAFSGGKDSFGLFRLLHKGFSEDGEAPSSFTLFPVLIDLGIPSATWDRDISRVRDYVSRYGGELLIVKTHIFKKAHIPRNTKNPCFLCSRMRRKRLYETAEQLRCAKIALAHHKDDIIETLLLNIFFSREISTMAPLQKTFGGKFHIIRPLAFIEERLLQQYAWKNAFPVIENPCPEKERSKRKYIKDLILQIEREEPKLRHNIFEAMRHVKREFLL